MRRRLLWSFLVCLLAAAQVCAQAIDAALIDRHLDALADITGLRIKKRVRYERISRDQVNEFLSRRMKEAVKPEDLRAEELALKKFGFVPQDFDLAKSTVDLLTEQAAAFYDFRRKKLFLTDWTSSHMEQSALIHELAHALADQHFNLERFIKAGASDDSSLARMAVMEGQASWLMTEVVARRAGQSLATSPSLLAAMSTSTESGAAQYPVFNAVPLYLRETLVFPYTKGMLFQHAVFEKRGKAAFSDVFRSPPQSTQQILHPESYFARVTPAEPRLPEMPSKRGYRRLTEGMMGEIDHAILLRQHLSQQAADLTAPNWRGGRYALMENKREKRAVLLYASEWNSAEAARVFYDQYQQILSKKWVRFEVASESSDRVTGSGDDGYFELRLRGAVVTSIEGLAAPAP